MKNFQSMQANWQKIHPPMIAGHNRKEPNYFDRRVILLMCVNVNRDVCICVSSSS